MNALKYSAVLALGLLAACSSKPMPEALESLQQAVEHDDYYLFEAKNPESDTCYIYYPGGLVNAEAYAPYTAAVAAEGYHSFLLRLPFDMSMLDTAAADKAKASAFAAGHCRRYVVGGHSLGGVSSADYLKDNPDDGAVLIAAYAREGTMLAEHQSPIMVIYGSEDLLATEEEIMAASGNLPASTRYVKIDGANHAQFGFYGAQNRDGEPRITRQEQQAQLVVQTVSLLGSMP